MRVVAALRGFELAFAAGTAVGGGGGGALALAGAGVDGPVGV